MIIAPDVFTSVIEQKPYTCMAIGPSGVDLPSYLLQGQKEPGYIIQQGEKPKLWYWEGLSVVKDKRCLYFEDIHLFPITEIATTKRSKALALVRELAQAISTLPSKFLDLSSNILPLWRIWGIEEGGFLILPQDLADLFSSCAEEDVRYAMVSAWVHHGLHTPFALCDQMVQLLYFAAIGFPPFYAPETREDGFRALPLTLSSIELDKQGTSFIDANLRLSLSKQREASGNLESQKALAWFVEATENLQWNVGNRIEAPTYEEMRKAPSSAAFLENQKRRSDRSIFWRKKGWIVISVVVAVTLVVWFTTGRIKSALAPPYTAGMEAQQVIEEYYRGQNELDLQKMEASLARKVKNPASMEVTNLFVSRQTRQAYEGITTQIDPNVWIANGKQALLEGTFLYGVADVRVRALDSENYEVTSVLYSPYPYFEDQEGTMVEEGEIVIFTYEQVQHFGVGVSKRGWLEITSLTNKSLRRLENLRIPTYKREVQAIGTPQ
ncbi:MAG TPA: hypothetical protein VJ869_06810 [Sphaerochaeta sp.]|nr:hypothetical protein [Sphaerochaeta sp.]